jgi:hypothetical protein
MVGCRRNEKRSTALAQTRLGDRDTRYPWDHSLRRDLYLQSPWRRELPFFARDAAGRNRLSERGLTPPAIGASRSEIIMRRA